MYTPRSLKAESPHRLSLPEYKSILSSDSLKAIFSDCGDFEARELSFGLRGGIKITACWLDGIVSGSEVTEGIIRPFTELLRSAGVQTEQDCISQVMSGAVYSHSAKRRDTLDDVVDALTHGFCALIFDGAAQAVCFEVKTSNTRSVSEPTLEKSIKGAKDSFVETLRTNTALVRKRICSPKLKVIESSIGRKSHTKLAIMFVDGVASPDTVRELASQEMKNSAGATWDAATAGNAIGTWSASFGDQIDIVASNNDGMGMSMFLAWSKAEGVPTFGYDANSDAVAAIAEGYGGTISQHADVQAYLTLRVLRNALDGVDIDTGIGTEDDAGNVLSDDVYVYKDDERSYYALNVAVTADNYKDFTDSTVVWAPVSTQLDSAKHPTKKVWLNIYNASDNFLSSTYQPLLQKYDDLLNLDVEYIGGDGQTESNITNRLGNPSQYDAFAINMVKTDNAASYTALLNQ